MFLSFIIGERLLLERSSRFHMRKFFYIFLLIRKGFPFLNWRKFYIFILRERFSFWRGNVFHFSWEKAFPPLFYEKDFLLCFYRKRFSMIPL